MKHKRCNNGRTAGLFRSIDAAQRSPLRYFSCNWGFDISRDHCVGLMTKPKPKATSSVYSNGGAMILQVY